MQLDDRALQFLTAAKQAGKSKEEAFAFLQSKGYDVGIAQPEHVAQPYTPPQDKYSGADKAKYTTRAAIEGATLGLGDIVAGGTNVLASDLAQATHGKSFGDRVQAAGRLLRTLNPVISPISAIQALRRPEFKEGRREFVTEQEEFAKSHPYMNISGELAGGLLTGGLGGGGKAIASQAGKQGIKALAKEGARQGAIYGGLYGAGSGLTEEADKLSVENALKGGASGAIGGAVLGAALPAAAVGGTRAAQAFLGTRGYAQRAANEIIQEAGGKEIGQIVRTEKGTRALKEAIKADDKVARALRDISDQKLIDSADKTKDIINNTLGVDNIVNARNQARAFYDDVVNNSTTKIPQSIYNNKGTREALAKAVAEDYSGELAKKGPNSLAVAQKAKEKLDDMIEASYEIGDYGVRKPTSKTQDLIAVKNAFVKQLDAIAPEYKMAREQFTKAVKPYDLLEGLTKTTGRERANTIKSVLTNKNKEAISSVFGKEKSEQLFDTLRAQSVENERFNKLYNAAETKLTKEQPQSQGLIREALESVGSIVGNAVDMARFGGARRGRRQIGEILLGIEKERNTPSISKIIANKIKEEGGYAMKPLDDTQMAYHGTGVRGIKQLDTSYMGTGEGAQAHGWGTYLAGTPETGERYRLALTNYLDNWQYDGKPVYEHIGMKPYMMSKAATKKDVGSFKETLKNMIAHERDAFNKNDYPSRYSYWDDMYKKVSKMDDSKLSVSQKGQLYEVKIPKNDVLLEENKPLYEQTASVKNALSKVYDKVFGRKLSQEYQSPGVKGFSLNKDGGQIYRQIADELGSEKDASLLLEKYGIKGIAYNGMQDGRSFVIFNPMKDTKINRTFYSILATLASAGLLNDKEHK